MKVESPLTPEETQRLLDKLITHVPLFAGLTHGEANVLLWGADKCRYSAGDEILREGTAGDFMYVVIHGETVAQKQQKGGFREMGRFKAGDIFGEMALVDRSPRSASVLAASDCLLIRISEADCRKNPDISSKIFYNMARILSARLREAHGKILGQSI